MKSLEKINRRRTLETLGFYLSYVLAIIATLGYPMNGYSYILNLGGAWALRSVDHDCGNSLVQGVLVFLAVYFNLAVIVTTPYVLATVLTASSMTIILERYVGVGTVGIVGVLSS